MTSFEVEIVATWDEEAHVWTAVSKDVPGLVTEAATIEAVIESAKAVIPELLGSKRGVLRRLTVLSVFRFSS